MVAYARLLRGLGYDAQPALAVPWNTSVEPVRRYLLSSEPLSDDAEVEHAIVDISDPYVLLACPEHVREVYDHHSGYEDFWRERIGEHVHIELIGAAATLIYEAYEYHDMIAKLDSNTAFLLLTAILANTSRFQMGYVHERDRRAYRELQRIASPDSDWEDQYFIEVQRICERDPEECLRLDQKVFSGHIRFAQVELFDVDTFIRHVSLARIRRFFGTDDPEWLCNIIDIHSGTSMLFVGDDPLLRDRITR